MVHPADHLRRHVPRSPAGLLRVALLPLPSHPKVSDPQVAVLLKDQILRLQVTMDDPLGVKILQAEDDTSGDKL